VLRQNDSTKCSLSNDSARAVKIYSCGHGPILLGKCVVNVRNELLLFGQQGICFEGHLVVVRFRLVGERARIDICDSDNSHCGLERVEVCN
jgi:hypothetical protein